MMIKKATPKGATGRVYGTVYSGLDMGFALALGAGNGAVFQLAPQRFGKEIGVVTGLVGMTGGVGGFYLAASLGWAKQATGSYQAGLLAFAALALVALVCLTGVKARWRRTWTATAPAAGSPSRV